MENTELIYVKLSDIPETKTRKAFIKKILTSKGVITFKNKECTRVQCAKKEAYRSISELHLIVKSRFRLTSLQALMKIIKEIVNEEKCIALVYCTQINKVVLKYQPNVPKEYITTYSKNNYYTTKGVDGMSLKDYETIINKL